MKRIFLIDDDTDDVELFQLALSRLDRQTVLSHAVNGQHALELAQDPAFDTPDLIFLDLNMPVLRGAEFLAEMRSLNLFPETPVFVYSTSSAGQDVEKCLRLGARLFTKHSSFGKLVAGLELLID